MIHCFFCTSFTRMYVPEIRVLYRARACMMTARIRRFPAGCAPLQGDLAGYVARQKYSS